MILVDRPEFAPTAISVPYHVLALKILMLTVLHQLLAQPNSTFMICTKITCQMVKSFWPFTKIVGSV